MYDMQKDWLVEFITLCADVETASQIDGVEQLRGMAWELLSKGRKGELEKENFQEIDLEDDGNDIENDSDEDEEDDNEENIVWIIHTKYCVTSLIKIQKRRKKPYLKQRPH